MFSSQKGIVVKKDFTERFVKNFVHELSKIESDVHIANVDKRVNAKSITGLLSLNIKKHDVIRIDIISDCNVEIVQEDMIKVLEMIEMV